MRTAFRRGIVRPPWSEHLVRLTVAARDPPLGERRRRLSITAWPAHQKVPVARQRNEPAPPQGTTERAMRGRAQQRVRVEGAGERRGGAERRERDAGAVRRAQQVGQRRDPDAVEAGVADGARLAERSDPYEPAAIASRDEPVSIRAAPAVAPPKIASVAHDARVDLPPHASPQVVTLVGVEARRRVSLEATRWAARDRRHRRVAAPAAAPATAARPVRCAKRIVA